MNHIAAGRLLSAAALTSFALTGSLFAQPGMGPFGPGPGCNFFPTNMSSISLSYFGHPPKGNSSFSGPLQLLTSGTIDLAAGSITLPLYRGQVKTMMGTETAWYILTDVSDAPTAEYLGINFSPKLAFAGATARTANYDNNGNLVFDQGTVDFSPERTVRPGAATAFPPQTAQPGAVGDASYSPLVRVLNGGNIVFNAPMIAFGVSANDINFPGGKPDYTKLHDQVLAIDPFNMTVTVNLINGFAAGRPVWYISTEASTTLAAALEGAVYAPALAMIPLGRSDISSAADPLFVAINGVSDSGCANPQRQGLTAALTDGARPNNVLASIPTTSDDYSPLWDAIPYVWTDDAIAKGFRGQMREEFQILTLARDGLITGPGGGRFGAGDFIVNCPVVQRLN
jgi:hypothetical protein